MKKRGLILASLAALMVAAMFASQADALSLVPAEEAAEHLEETSLEEAVDVVQRWIISAAMGYDPDLYEHLRERYPDRFDDLPEGVRIYTPGIESLLRYTNEVFRHLSAERAKGIYNGLTPGQRYVLYPYMSPDVRNKVEAEKPPFVWTPQVWLPARFHWFVLVAALWSLPWKAVALWKAARSNHKLWFVALLLIQTLAVLEILYIFVLSKRGAGRARAVQAQ